MIKPKAFRGAGLTFESRNDSGRSLATTATAATASDPEGEAIVHRGSTFPKDTCTSTSSTCVPPKSSATPKAGKGWGGFLGNIFRSVSNSSTSVDSSASIDENGRHAPSPIGDIGYFAHPDEDNSDPDEPMPAPPAPPRRVVSEAPFQASTGTSSSSSSSSPGRKSSLLSGSNKMTRRHSISDSNLCQLRGGGRMSTSVIIEHAQNEKKSTRIPGKAHNMSTTTSTSTISTTNPNERQQRRRSSLKAQTGSSRSSISRSASMPSFQRAITFNKSVGFAIIPSTDDLPGSMRRKLYTSESEYNAISHRRDTEIAILKTRALSPFRANTDDNEEEEDSRACVWGIEHHLLTPVERHARAAKIRKTIDAVLGEQETQRELARQRGLDYNAYDTIGISTVSMRHSQTARIMALERARNVEQECKTSMMRRRKSDSVLEVANLKNSWSCSDSESGEECSTSLCDGNAYHQQGEGIGRPMMGKKTKSMKISSQIVKMKRSMSLNR